MDMHRIKKYATDFDSAIGARRTLARFTHVLGADGDAMAPSAPADAKTSFLRDIGATRDVPDGFRTLGGAAAGAYLGNKIGHPWLGGIAGASLARNVPALFHEASRKVAFRNMVTTGGAVAASAIFRGTPIGPILGFGVGWLAAGLLSYYGGLR